MKKVNCLELRYYDNILRYSDLHKADIVEIKKADCGVEAIHSNGDTKVILNFYEYFIDGVHLIEKIATHYWNLSSENKATGFLDEHFGWIGAFNNYECDKFLVKKFLLDEHTVEELEQFEPHSLDDESEEDLDDVTVITFDYQAMIYGCYCGDEMCGGLAIWIDYEEGYYYWHFGDKELVFCFEEKQYRETFRGCLEEIEFQLGTA
ncbi:MAG: hypothetical protein ACPG49_14225 [Chitinophagales bacterium]